MGLVFFIITMVGIMAACLTCKETGKLEEKIRLLEELGGLLHEIDPDDPNFEVKMRMIRTFTEMLDRRDDALAGKVLRRLAKPFSWKSLPGKR